MHFPFYYRSHFISPPIERVTCNIRQFSQQAAQRNSLNVYGMLIQCWASVLHARTPLNPHFANELSSNYL